MSLKKTGTNNDGVQTKKGLDRLAFNGSRRVSSSLTGRIIALKQNEYLEIDPKKCGVSESTVRSVASNLTIRYERKRIFTVRKLRDDRDGKLIVFDAALNR